MIDRTSLNLSSRTTTSLNLMALEVRSVVKSFGASHALQGVDFQVAVGERLALLGPNGAGKTTLVRAICGQVILQSGSIRLFSRDVRQSGCLDNLGIVPQELAIYSDLSAKENMEIFGRLHGLGRRGLKSRVEWALHWTGLGDRQNDLVASFSGGMKRRVNIACGVLHSPRLLLLDEPTVGVDPQSRQRIFDMLDDLHSQGTTIVLTTHHLDEAQSRCDRIVIIDHGKVIDQGTLNELIERTVGTQKRVLIQMEKQPQFAPKNLRWDSKIQRWTGVVQDVAHDLPGLLQEIRIAQGEVSDVEMHSPNLHDVFLNLTGRELRE